MQETFLKKQPTKRYYYKTTDGKGLLNLKTPDFDNVEGYIKISEAEFNEIVESKKPKHKCFK